MHLEIGTAAGGTLWQMVEALPGKDSKFVVVDPMRYFPKQFSIVKQNLRKHGVDPEQIDFRIQTSDEAFSSSEQLNERFDFIFVDGSHKLRYVTEDLRWSRLLNPGGTIAFHDYAPQFPGVQMAIDRFLSKYPNYSIRNHIDTLLVIEKTAPCPDQEVTWVDQAYASVLTPYLQIRHSIGKRFRNRK